MIEVVPPKKSKLIDNKSPIIPSKNIVWNNYDNQHFYQTVAVEGLEELAEKGGLATGCDLALLKPYWSKANSILEVGAGYGRVINYLLENGYSGEITAIERCDVFFDHLQKTFASHANVKLMHEDIHNCEQIPEKFDLILFLWSGLADFSKDEQPIILKKLVTLLKPSGIIIVDTMPINTVPLQASQFGNQSFLIKIKENVVYTYEPNPNEIQIYAYYAEKQVITCKKCQTDTHRKRLLYILK